MSRFFSSDERLKKTIQSDLNLFQKGLVIFGFEKGKVISNLLNEIHSIIPNEENVSNTERQRETVPVIPNRRAEPVEESDQDSV